MDTFLIFISQIFKQFYQIIKNKIILFFRYEKQVYLMFISNIFNYLFRGYVN